MMTAKWFFWGLGAFVGQITLKNDIHVALDGVIIGVWATCSEV